MIQSSEPTKQCRVCEKVKTISHFYQASTGRLGVTGTCKLCKPRYNEDNRMHRNKVQQAWRKRNPDYEYFRQLKADYGLTREDYHSLLTSCASGCMICGAHLTQARICVDHDHDTGRVRGLLCYQCNVAIGHLKDNPSLMRRAAEYIERGYLHERHKDEAETGSPQFPDRSGELQSAPATQGAVWGQSAVATHPRSSAPL